MCRNLVKRVRAVELIIVAGCLWGAAVYNALAQEAVAGKADTGARRSAGAATDLERERAQMQGTWQSSETVTSIIAGKVQPPREETLTWVIVGNKLIQSNDGQHVEDEWAVELDPTKSPKWIDLSSLKSGTWLGIYEITGDALRIFVSLSGERPVEFPDKAGAPWLLRRVSREPAELVQRYANAPACFWMIEPSGPAPLRCFMGIVSVFETDPDGAALFTMAYSFPEGTKSPDYYPVLLDTDDKRYCPKLNASGRSGRSGSPGVVLRRWRMDPDTLPASKVALIGVEATTEESRRLAAEAARKRAQDAGLEALAWPEVGKTYPFNLTTVEGRVVRSSELVGKVVVIDCWATWCSPCMALMPELKRCHERWHRDGLEIVGISLDEDEDSFRRVVKSEGLAWTQVLVPSEQQTRQLWADVSGITGIPRVLVIDRAGILRFDTANNLEENIAGLMAESGGAAAAKPSDN
ncbi:MAG: thioredoxin-like domain-containing protein [Pirellulales bacterium]